MCPIPFRCNSGRWIGRCLVQSLLFELAEEDSHENPSDNIFLDDELDMMLRTDRHKLNAQGELGLDSILNCRMDQGSHY